MLAGLRIVLLQQGHLQGTMGQQTTTSPNINEWGGWLSGVTTKPTAAEHMYSVASQEEWGTLQSKASEVLVTCTPPPPGGHLKAANTGDMRQTCDQDNTDLASLIVPLQNALRAAAAIDAKYARPAHVLVRPASSQPDRRMMAQSTLLLDKWQVAGRVAPT
jgi:hypothetical protein